jgi:putative ABC transport system permease protein
VRGGGVVRDYARTWGAALMPTRGLSRRSPARRARTTCACTSSRRRHAALQAAIRAALPAARARDRGRAGLLRRSLAIFDRSFAITYALEAIAIVIGLAG